MNAEKPFLICILGPTAIGKTPMTIAIAKALSTEIISCDSRQFFKEMKIGTAVPDETELALVRHHFIQNKSIFEQYNVGDFEKDALNLLDQLYSEGNKTVVMVGGSGLYSDAVIYGLDDFPEVATEYRDHLTDELEKNGIESLQRELNEKDPTYYSEVDINNPHRLIRALEVIRSSGFTYSSFRNKGSNSTVRNFNTVIIGLNADREIIYDRINHRVDMMIDEGLIDEARRLYPHKDLNALHTVGYRELFSYFDGKYTLDQAIQEIKKNTRRYAKRQLTWFRKNEDIRWFDYQTEPYKIVQYILKKMEEKQESA